MHFRLPSYRGGLDRCRDEAEDRGLTYALARVEAVDVEQMTQGKIEEPRIKRKVQLASKTELKKWADIGPRSLRPRHDTGRRRSASSKNEREPGSDHPARWMPRPDAPTRGSSWRPAYIVRRLTMRAGVVGIDGRHSKRRDGEVSVATAA